MRAALSGSVTIVIGKREGCMAGGVSLLVISFVCSMADEPWTTCMMHPAEPGCWPMDILTCS